jgi:Protein of unknown function (DUF2889)
VNDTPVHRRTISVESYPEGETLQVVGRLRDERPGQESHQLVHDMELILRVSLQDMRITGAEAQMHAFPHDECPFVAPKFAELTGLSIARGFTRALRELFAGVSGCQHLHELARVTGPAVFQANAALRSSQMEAARVAPNAEATMRAMAGMCHVWSADGVGSQKLEFGWRPGGPEYPVPSLARLRERTS